MAGRGPAPKDPNKRARRNGDPIALRVIQAPPTDQPELPALLIRDDGDMVAIDWPDVTREWWTMWAGSPLSTEFTDTDWSELRDTARLHALFWLGDKTVAGELRLRVAKFGATPEDRARLRIQFAQADEAEERRDRKPGAQSRERRGPLKSVEAPPSDVG
jgi:hypothetical protein